MADVGVHQMWEDIEPIGRRTVVQEVVSRIKTVLLKGDLSRGDRLPSEVELVERLSVSRSAVREAIRILATQGLVTVKRGEGTFIEQKLSTVTLDPLVFSLILDGKTPEELLELREMLEVGILDILMAKATKEDIRKMEKAVRVFEGDYGQGVTVARILCEHDLAFHRAFAEATHNPLIVKIAKTIWEMFTPSIEKGLKRSDKNKGPGEHRLILEAIIERDFEKAKQAIHKALRTWREDGYGVLADEK